MTAADLAVRRGVPHACGVYIMRDAAMSVLYVGKAKDLAKRVAQYFNPNKPDLKNQVLAPLVRKIDYIHCASEREALLWERRLIGRHQPFFNSMWKDDKSYPFVKISLEEEFPRFCVVRKKHRDGGAYFGPYPQVSSIRRLLRTLWKRKLFPLRACDYSFSSEKPLPQKKIKSCLYYHTRECPAPCAGRISPKDYRAIARNAVLFFSGRTRHLKERFTGEMSAASAALDYERAALLRDNVAALEHMSERVRFQEVGG
ncbi:MAG: GIY-YIG nuclease family protein, partial [Elusimicrobiota bacterium]